MIVYSVSHISHNRLTLDYSMSRTATSIGSALPRRTKTSWSHGTVRYSRSAVAMEKNGKIYTVEYEVFRGVVRLKTGQATHTDNATAKVIAKQLLREMVDSGLADKLRLGKSCWHYGHSVDLLRFCVR